MNYYLVHYKEQPTLKFPNEFTKVIKADNPKDAVQGIEGVYVIESVKMIQNPNTSYTVLKNHLHNTLELTKGDVRTMVEEAINNIVERRLDVFLKYNDGITRVIDAAIREKSWNALLFSDETRLDEKLQEKVVDHVVKTLIADIGLDVKIVPKNDNRKES